MVRATILFEFSLQLKDKVLAAIVKLHLRLHFVFLSQNFAFSSFIVEFRIKNLQVVFSFVLFVAVSYCYIGRWPVTCDGLLR